MVVKRLFSMSILTLERSLRSSLWFRERPIQRRNWTQKFGDEKPLLLLLVLATGTILLLLWLYNELVLVWTRDLSFPFFLLLAWRSTRTDPRRSIEDLVTHLYHQTDVFLWIFAFASPYPFMLMSCSYVALHARNEERFANGGQETKDFY